jgi:hypothetical protein
VFFQHSSTSPAACLRSVLEDNQLGGSLPASWGQGAAFPRLQTLGLAGSGVRGALPPAWGAGGGFPELQLLSVARCGLTGSLPVEWAAPGRFPKLKKMWVQAV